jgi:hypothetical protein
VKIAFRTSIISMPTQFFVLLPRHLFREINLRLNARAAEKRRVWRSQMKIHDCKTEGSE